MASDGEIKEITRRWTEVAKRISWGEREGILCPQNQDDIVKVEWLPFRSGVGGEWWVHCPTCKVESFILDREHVEPKG
jgi:hypothetical protein